MIIVLFLNWLLFFSTFKNIWSLTYAKQHFSIIPLMQVMFLILLFSLFTTLWIILSIFIFASAISAQTQIKYSK